ncbi:flagellar protein [Alkalicella caledoniensis]|uniref:Flagellar protein n=2 Tax=Alkalicella caledoniensis TaxID=2731377 RepID=A0A7G9WDI4_ALKCA|nr:flagellar protein [Alkalicella caledoniensis]
MLINSLTRNQNTNKLKQTSDNNFSKVFSHELNHLVFSKHAINRIEHRGIELSEETLCKINTAMDKLVSKGSRDSLVFIDDVAYVVNPKNKVIITAVDKENLKENVFTGIDSAIFM